MRKLFIISIVTLSTLGAQSFSISKKILLNEIYKDNKATFYCNNPYEIKTINGKRKAVIIPSEAHYTPRNKYTKKGQLNERARRVEWEHVMPAQNFGKHLPCWRDGGRKACQKDPIFQKMEADMMNLVPAIGEVNGDRSNYRYGADEPQIGQYGNCEFQVDFKNKRAYVRDDIKGDIARIYLYMSETYNINLSKQERQMMEAWDKQDPIDEWEIEKKQRIHTWQIR